MSDRQIIFSAPMIRALLDGRKRQTRRLLTPGTTTVLGNRVSAKSPAWTGLRFDEAVVRTTSPISGLPDPHLAVPWEHPEDAAAGINSETVYRVRPLWQSSDRLWVRENHQFRGASYDDGSENDPSWTENEWFRIWGSGGPGDSWDPVFPDGWQPSRHMGVHDLVGPEHDEGPTVRGVATKVLPSIHMPRWASRLTLLVTEVRVERLQDISEEDAVAEGIRDDGFGFTPDPADPVAAPPMDTAAWAFQALWCRLHGPQSWEENPWIAAVSFQAIRQNIDSLDRPVSQSGGAA